MTELMAENRVFITGGSSGIGRATAIELTRLGASVIILGRDEGRLQDTLSQCKGSENGYVALDLKEHEQLPGILKDLASKYGPFTGLLHGAGRESICPVNLLKNSRVEPLFEASVWPMFSLAKAVTKKGVVDGEKRFSFVTMSSVAAMRGQQGMSVYSSVKGAIDAAVRSLAVELAPKNIRVNSIIAGAVKTEMHDRITQNINEDAIKEYNDKHLFGFGEVTDVVNAAIFLLSEQSKWITGTSLVVDGGYLCK